MSNLRDTANIADERAFRTALGQFATGVTIVTAATPTRVFGLTVNSFSSVSLTPPLVLWCLGHDAAAFELFAQAAHFAISVLNEDQSDLSIACARHAQHELIGDQFVRKSSGVAFIKDALACFECRRHSQFEAGDHLIIIGEVVAMSQIPGRPLIYQHSNYQKLK